MVHLLYLVIELLEESAAPRRKDMFSPICPMFSASKSESFALSLALRSPSCSELNPIFNSSLSCIVLVLLKLLKKLFFSDFLHEELLWHF